MSSPIFYPKFRACDPSTGLPLVGGKLYTYVAGTTTPQATYSDAALSVANANPVILDANGEASIYCGPVSYKLVLQDSTGAEIWTFDNYSPDIDSTSSDAQWFPYTGSIAFSTTTSFSVLNEDATSFLTAGRRIRTSNTAGTVYSTVVSSSFGGVNTTVVVVNDGSSVLDSGINSLAYGLLSYANPSYLDPLGVVVALFTADVTGYGSETQLTAFTVTSVDAVRAMLTAFTEQLDTLSTFASGTFTAKYPGYYKVDAVVVLSDTAAGTRTAALKKTGSTLNSTSVIIAANGQITAPIATTVQLDVGDTLKLYVTGAATTTVKGTGTTFNVTRVR